MLRACAVPSQALGAHRSICLVYAGRHARTRRREARAGSQKHVEMADHGTYIKSVLHVVNRQVYRRCDVYTYSSRLPWALIKASAWSLQVVTPVHDAAMLVQVKLVEMVLPRYMLKITLNQHYTWLIRR